MLQPVPAHWPSARLWPRPTPVLRMPMLHGFNQGWMSFQGGAGVEPVTGTTTLDDVLRGLLAR